MPIFTAHVRSWGLSRHGFLQCGCLLLTQSGHACHGAKARICLGLSILVNRPGATLQRRGASGQLAKRRRTTKRKVRKAPIAPASIDHSAEQFDDLKRERDETLEQLAATSEVLRVIRRSPADVQPVFDMIAESAARLWAAQFCFVYRCDGQLLHFVAHHSVTPEMIEINRRVYPQPPSRGSVAARAILEPGEFTEIKVILPRVAALIS